MFKYKKKLAILATLGICSFAHALVPNAPGLYVGVSKLDDSNKSVRISVKDNSNNEDGFYLSLYDYETSSLFQTLNIDAGESSFVYTNVTGLSCDKMYQAVMVAYNADGNSSQSDLRSFSIKGTFGAKCFTEVEDEVNAPGPYIGVTSVKNSKTSVRVNFKDNSNNEDGFRIFDGKGINVNISANDESIHPDAYVTLTGLTCNKIYKIQALAYKGAIVSKATNPRDFNIHTTFAIPCNEDAPIANAHEDKVINIGETVSIIGSGTDNGTIVSYQWKEGDTLLANTASFNYTSTVSGVHTLTLTVTDNDGLMDSDTMMVTVNKAESQVPIAKAGNDQTITEGESVELDGSNSYDPDGTVVAYEWSENGAILSNSALFTLTNLLLGTHTITLKVTDNDNNMNIDTLVVNVKKANNQGVSFHTAFISNYDTSGSLSLFISSKESSIGQIKLLDNNETIDFTIAANTIEKISIPKRMLLAGTGISTKILEITSEKDIVIVGLNQRFQSTDAFLLLPDKLLGKEYYTMGYANILADEFAIVAQENNTQVKVMLANNLGNFEVNLSKGEVYQYQKTAELTGSHILSNKNIAVLSGNRCTNIPNSKAYCDHIVEQMLPVNTWEKEFITVGLKTRIKGDTFRILASEDNTVITINGTAVSTLNQGEYYETILKDRNHITANSPILVSQYSNGSSFDNVTSDPFMALVPAVTQYDNKHIINTPSGFTDYINVIAPTSAINDIKLDGVDIDSNEFIAVSGTTYSAAQIQISSGSHTITSDEKIGLLGYGYASYDSYGYPSSLRLTKH